MTTVMSSPVRPDLEPSHVSRLGLIALATDLTSERDAWRVLPPERAALHVTRVPYAKIGRAHV